MLETLLQRKDEIEAVIERLAADDETVLLELAVMPDY